MMSSGCPQNRLVFEQNENSKEYSRTASPIPMARHPIPTLSDAGVGVDEALGELGMLGEQEQETGRVCGPREIGEDAIHPERKELPVLVHRVTGVVLGQMALLVPEGPRVNQEPQTVGVPDDVAWLKQ